MEKYQLAGEVNRKGGHLLPELLNHGLHDSGEVVNITFVGDVEQLLHDLTQHGPDMLLHLIAHHEHTKGKGGLDFHGQLRVLHSLGDNLQGLEDILGVGERDLGKVADGPACLGRGTGF